MGGRKPTSKKATSTCPATRSTNRPNRNQSRSSALLVHPFVVLVPVALEELLRVVLELQFEKFLHLREAGVDLTAQGVAVVGGEVASTMLEADVDQAAEHVARLDESARGVLDVNVEDHARVRAPRPRQEALAILLDEPHRSVDHVDLVAARVVAH